MRLRQIALVTSKLEDIVGQLCRELSLKVAFRDPGVGVFGLENAVLAVGDTFLEIVSPLRQDCSATRFLERRGGDSGYMLILQSNNLDADRRRLEGLGIRIVWEVSLEDIATIHLHPRDLGAAIVSIDQPHPPQSWRWAGPGWEATVDRSVVDAIVAVEIAASDPTATAKRWARVMGLEATTDDDGSSTVELENALLHFREDHDGRADGIIGFDLRATNGRREELDICGTRIRLV